MGRGEKELPGPPLTLTKAVTERSPSAAIEVRRDKMGRLYLYGFIDGNETAAVPSGVDGVSPVSTIAHQGLGCVVSDYAAEELRSLPKEKLLKSLLAHQQVLEGIMAQHTVLPAKFGTLLEGSQEAYALLSQGHRKLRDALASIQDKVEIEVAATWDTSQVLQEISKEEKTISAREAIASKGKPALEQRIWLGQMVKIRMDQLRESYSERMETFLSPLSVGVASNALVSDEMVMNVAFLVERARQPEFDDRVRRLDELFQKGIAFRVIGPLPPYSFSTVQITRLSLEQVEEARSTLRLGETISEAEVRRAYRHLAAEEQRNLRPGDESPKAPGGMLKQASDLLLSYCRARNEIDNRPSTGVVGSLFAIVIKGPGSRDIRSTSPGRWRQEWGA